MQPLEARWVLTDLTVSFAWIDSGGSTVSELQSGVDYTLQAFVEDTRDAANQGVLSAFLDVGFDSALVRAPGAPLSDFFPEPQDPFQTRDGTNTRDEDTLMLGGGVSNLPDAGADAPVLLFTAPFSAVGSGQLTLAPELNDNNGERPTRLVGSVVVDEADVTYTGLTIDVLGAGIVVDAGDGVSISEDGATDTFTVTLTQDPSSTVTVPLTLSEDGQATLSGDGFAGGELSFTPGGPLTRTVTVTAVDDPTVEGPHNVTVLVGAAESADGDYDGIDADDVAVAITDNDSAGFLLTDADALEVSEFATTDSFNVELTAQPQSNVILNITTDDVGEVTVSEGGNPASGAVALTFTPDNWDTPQQVTLRGVPDLLFDDDETSTITVSVAAGSDAAFQGLANQTADVVTTNGDVPGFTLEPLSVTVSESGAPGEAFTVKLNAQPLPGVALVLDVAPTDDTEADVDLTTVTLDESNWMDGVAVTVVGVDDDALDGAIDSAINVTVDTENSDTLFAGVADRMVMVRTEDNDQPALIVSPATDASIAESGSVEYTVVLGSLPASDVVVDVTIGAGATVDLTRLTFTPENGTSAQTITVSGLEDGVVDGDQSPTLTVSINDGLSNDAFDGLPDQTRTITVNDDNESFVSIELANGGDGAEAGPTAAEFVVRLSTASATETTVNYVVAAASTATAGIDFTAPSGSVVFAPGETEQTITVPVLEDSDVDPAETIVLELQSVADGGLPMLDSDAANLTATATIVDNEAPTVNLELVDGAAEGGTLRFRVFQDVAAAEPTEVTLSVAAGSSADAADFQPFTPTATIDTGETETFAEIPVVDDNEVELTETLTLDLTIDQAAPGLVPGVTQATATIDDTDTATLTIAPDGDVDEDGSTPGVFRFELSAPSSVETQITYTLGGDAVEGTDYATIANKTVTFGPGETTATVEIDPTADSTVELGEQVTLAVTSVLNTTGRINFDDTIPVAPLTINNDDTATVSVASDGNGAEADESPTVFTVSMSAPSATDTIVTYLVGGDATPDVDYNLPDTLTVTIPAGQLEGEISLATVDDDDAEGAESIVVTLDGFAARLSDSITLAADPSAEGLIADDEAPVVFVALVGDGSEAGLGPGSFQIVRTSASLTPTTVTYSLGGTAQNGVDYVEIAGPFTVEIPGEEPGSLATVTITVLDDNIAEGAETVELMLTGLVGDVGPLTIDPTRDTATLTITDNDTAGVLFTATDDGAAEEGSAESYEVVLTSQPIDDVTISVTTSDPTESTPPGSVVTFTPDDWDQPQTVTVSAADDGVVDGDRLSTLTATASSVGDAAYDGLTDTAALNTIDTDTATLSVAALTSTVVEGTGDGLTEVTFRITLSGDVEDDFDVAYATSDGTATAEDYVDNDGQISFTGADGETRDVTVQITRDSTVEADEVFSLALTDLLGLSDSAAARVTLDTTPAEATIENDDTATVSIASVDLPEGTGDGATGYQFVLTLDQAVQGGFSIRTATVAGTAEENTDFIPQTATLDFFGFAGEQDGIIVAVLADATIEADEQFQVMLGVAGALADGVDSNDIIVSGSPATGTIRNDDEATLGFALSASTVLEESGAHTVEITLSSPNGATLPETLSVRVTDLGTGTADASADYTFATQTVEFPAGSTGGETRTISLTVTDDGVLEENETIDLSLEVLGDPDGLVSIGQTEHTVTITDDPRTGVIEGVVWVDANNNGQQDAGELPMSGVTVTLDGTDSQGTAVSEEAVTDSEGVYRFTGLAGGEYSVRQTQPEAYVDGGEQAGAVDGSPSGQPADNAFEAITLPPTGQATGYNFFERGLTPQLFDVRAFLTTTVAGYLAEGASAPAEVNEAVEESGGPVTNATPAVAAATAADPATDAAAFDVAFAQLARFGFADDED